MGMGWGGLGWGGGDSHDRRRHLCMVRFCRKVKDRDRLALRD